MAIDTAAKRMAALLVDTISPDGSISQADRPSLLGQFYEVAGAFTGDLLEGLFFVGRITRNFASSFTIRTNYKHQPRISRRFDVTLER